MKLLPLASLALIASLTLTGCSPTQSLSIEEQTKLAEYENCLAIHRSLFLDNFTEKDQLYETEVRNKIIKNEQKLAIYECEKFRP